MKRVAGYLFILDDDGRRLTVRKSWRSYFLGCAIAIPIFVAALLLIVNNLRGDRTYYVDATPRGRHSRHVPGKPVLLENQTWSQYLQSTICPAVAFSPLLLVPAFYVLFGAEDQRKPFVFDRERGRVLRGGKEICKLSSVVAIRLVESSGGRGRARQGHRTGIFAKLNAAPWSIELECFRRFGTAKEFAQEFSGFLHVPLVDDPLTPWLVQNRTRPGRGFEVLPPGENEDPERRGDGPT